MNDQQLAVGDWVRHPEFGDGLILEARGAGDAASVVVSFPDKSQRRLVLKFARLSRLEPQPGKPPADEEASRPTRKARKRGSG